MKNVFTVGQKLSASFICDSSSFLTATVIKRTAKFVTLKVDGYQEEKRVKVQDYDNDAERCYPLGNYSMALSFSA